MAKITKTIRQTALDTRQELMHFYINKYYALWMTHFTIDGDMTDEQKYYLLKLFWVNGQACCFKITPFTNSKDVAPTSDIMCFADYVPLYYNTYDFPIQVMAINHRAVTFIPNFPLDVDSNVVIGWCSKNQKPLDPFVQLLITKIVDVEMVLNTNLTTMKMPFFIAVSPEDKDRITRLMDAIMNDEPVVWGDFENILSIKNVITSTPYLIDKLYDYKTSRENELLTYLGLQNNPIEKRERLLTDEVNANNEVIETSGNSFVEAIQEFFDRCNKLFGTNYSIKAKETMKEEKNPIEQGEENDEEI